MMTQVILGLHEKSSNSIFQKVYHENTPIGIVTAITSTTRSVDTKEDDLESRAKIREDVIKAMTNDKFYVIGVHGPGGVGKSKLLEDIEKRVKQEKLFDVVVTANVSSNPNLKRIQGEIAYALGLKIMNEETTRGRADMLCKRLESDSHKNILIILDNLWKKLELKEVGIPCGYDNKIRGCKLLLSSRYREVLRIDMGSDREFRLNELEHGEARKLFERTVGDRVNDSEFKGFVDRVVKNCGGLPLFIVSSAKRLKHGHLATWRNALTEEGSGVKSLVKLNYNDLQGERLKKLFLVCALCPGRILVGYALIYCMGLGLLKEFSKTLEDARDGLIIDLQSLQDSSLLLDSDDMERFRMHDLFVDVAISMHDEFEDMKWNALVGRKDCGFKEWSEDELTDCTTISFPHVGIDELPEKLECPNLRMLLLLEHNPSLKVPESFFESMKNLQVLDLTGLSFTSLPSSIELLQNLKSLCLDRCRLKDVTILGKLKGLQFLSFRRSAIARLPKEIGELTGLRFLDLTGCTRLRVIEPGVLGSLVNLEEIYMEDSFDQWEDEDKAPRSNASLAELKNMKNLSTLYIAIPHSTNLSRNLLPFEKLKKYKIHIGNVPDWSAEYKEFRTLKLKLNSGDLRFEEWVQECLQRTQDLRLDGLQDVNDNIHDLCVEGFQELKHLHVRNSPSLHYVVPSIENVHCIAFTILESLFLENLNKLKMICPGSLAPISFSKLKIVKVDSCGEIKQLFPSSMMKIFLQLEEIEISICPLMKHIVGDAEADEDGDEIHEDPEAKSCNLRRLTLQNLPKMTSFIQTVDHSVIFFSVQQVSLPWLESLTLSELPKLKEIWKSQFPLDVSNLKFLRVEDCASLSSIIPSNLLLKLQNLEAITVQRCQLIQEVFNIEGLTTSGDVEILSRLTKLTLSGLPSLGCIWNKNPRRVLCFRNLRALKVQNCENLRFLFSYSMAKALGQIKEIEIASCKLMEEIIVVEEGSATTDTLRLPLLTSLSLEELPNLRTFSYGNYHIHCPSLTRLRISGCSKMMTFSSLDGKQQSMTADIGLQQMFGRINSSLSLPVFFHQNVIFPKLEELRVEKCQCLRNLFTVSMAKSLGQLQYLGLGGCEEMEYIVAREEEKPEEAVEIIVIPRLVTLYLHNMPKLRSFCDGKHISVWPSLKEFTIEDCKAVEVILGDASCGKLEGSVPTLQPLLLVEKVGLLGMESMRISHMDNVKKIWLDELASNAFSKLKTLIVEHCEKLPSIFSSNTIFARFRNLEQLTVTNCASLEVVFHVEEFNFSEAHSTSTFQLRELVLRQLPKMKHMWSGLPQVGLKFGHLRCMKAYECESLKSLFSVSVAKSMTQLEELLVFSCGVEEIIAEEDEGVGTGTLFFPRLTSLRFHELPELRSFYRNSHASTWPFLKELKVTDCSKMRTFSLVCEIQSWQSTTTGENQPALFSAEKVIPHLEKLTLTREDVVMMQQHDIFSNLRQLGLACYHDENVVLPSNFLLQRFPNLEELLVGCSTLEEIFPEDAFGHGGATPCGGLTGTEKPLKALRNLKLLWLGDLCNLRRVWKDSSLMVEILKQIESLSIHKCHSLSIIFPSPISFPSLTGLRIHNCAGLVHMGTCSAVKNLVHLIWLNLGGCGAMEDVVTNDGNGVEEITFSKLLRLTLDGLPSLGSFSPTNCTFKFPSLVRVTVMQCPKMNIFCKGALRTPKLDKVLLSYENDEWHWEGDLNTTIQTLST